MLPSGTALLPPSRRPRQQLMTRMLSMPPGRLMVPG